MTASVVAALDPRLPGLDEILDARRAAALFAGMWGREVRDCRLLGTRYDPGMGCVATYAVVPEGGPATIGVVELEPDRRRVRSYEDDPGLPGLREAADPDAVASLVGSVVEGAGRTTVVPVRYRPGHRAVLRYEVDSPSGPLVLFGKVVSAGLTALAAAFVNLHERARAGSGPVVPTPTVVDERLGLLVLPTVEGRPLHAFAFDSDVPVPSRLEGFSAAGRSVALLHQGPAPAVAPPDDIAEIERSSAALRAIDPGLAERWETVLGEVAAMGVGAVAPVPSHGALRTDQIVLTPDGPSLLDLDGFCAARPARDVGNLLAYLGWRATRRPHDAAVCGAGRQAFLDGYGPLAAPADVAHHEGLSLLKIAARRYRNLDIAEWPLVPDLVETAASLARRGA
jgi:hypothetical protein